jgi:cell division protein FtsL
MKLSRREKVLIALASAAVLIFAAARFVVMPLTAAQQAQQQRHEELSTQKAMMDMKFQMETTTRENNAAAAATVENIYERYTEAIPKEDIGRMLTELVVSNDFLPVSLAVQDPGDYEIPEPEPAEGEEASGETPPEPPPAAFLLVHADMVLSGNYASLQKLIDSLREIDHIRLSGFSFEEVQETDEDGEPISSSLYTRRNIPVKFEVILIKDPEDVAAERAEAAESAE